MSNIDFFRQQTEEENRNEKAQDIKDEKDQDKKYLEFLLKKINSSKGNTRIKYILAHERFKDFGIRDPLVGGGLFK